MLDNSAYVVVAGPANTYAHYITTREEYAVQRYEGASTIFGQCNYKLTYAFINAERTTDTLEAYMDKYTSLVPFLADTPPGTPASDAAPPELTSSAISLQVILHFLRQFFSDVEYLDPSCFRCSAKWKELWAGPHRRGDDNGIPSWKHSFGAIRRGQSAGPLFWCLLIESDGPAEQSPP